MHKSKPIKPLSDIHIKITHNNVEIIGLPNPLRLPDIISIVIFKTSKINIYVILIVANSTILGFEVNIPAKNRSKTINIILNETVKIVPKIIQPRVDLIHLL